MIHYLTEELGNRCLFGFVLLDLPRDKSWYEYCQKICCSFGKAGRRALNAFFSFDFFLSMKALRYHVLLAAMAGGILFVLFNLMPNQAQFDVADSFSTPSDSLVALPPVGAGQGIGMTIGY